MAFACHSPVPYRVTIVAPDPKGKSEPHVAPVPYIFIDSHLYRLRPGAPVSTRGHAVGTRADASRHRRKSH
jgi:hypothetical protein